MDRGQTVSPIRWLTISLTIVGIVAAALPPWNAVPPDKVGLALIAAVLLGSFSRDPLFYRYGSGWPALTMAVGYQEFGASWVAALLFLIQVVWLLARRRPWSDLGRSCAVAAPVFIGLFAARLAPSAHKALVTGMVFLLLSVLIRPEGTDALLRRKVAEEGLWCGALVLAGSQGAWVLSLTLFCFLFVFSSEATSEFELKRSLAQQMRATEVTLRDSQRKHQADRGRFRELLSRQAFLDDFQVRALGVESEGELGQLLLASVDELQPHAQAGLYLLASGPNPGRLVASSRHFRLAEFEPLPSQSPEGKILRGGPAPLLISPINGELLFLWRSAEGLEPLEEQQQELLEQLLNRARLLIRILEQRRELAVLLQQRTSALEELSESKAQLVQSEKMVSIGQLAAGVAHEINSPLAAIQLQLQLGQRRLKKSDMDGVARSFETCLLAAERAKSIIDSLQAFSRYSDGSRDVITLREVVDQSHRMLEAHFEQANIETQIRIPELPPIEINAQEVGQILTNILMNAVDALGERPSGRRIMISALSDSGRQRLTIANNGLPISESDLDQLFDPFFTTKEVGKGTGLGLSLAYQFAKSHGGDLSASNHKQWVHFTLTLPER